MEKIDYFIVVIIMRPFNAMKMEKIENSILPLFYAFVGFTGPWNPDRSSRTGISH